MSLINQVLRDLEQRQDCPAVAANGVLQGLDVPAQAPRPPIRRRMRIAYVAVFALLALGLTLLGLALFGNEPLLSNGLQPGADLGAVAENRQLVAAQASAELPKSPRASAPTGTAVEVAAAPSASSTKPNPKPPADKAVASLSQQAKPVATTPARIASKVKPPKPVRAEKVTANPPVNRPVQQTASQPAKLSADPLKNRAEALVVVPTATTSPLVKTRTPRSTSSRQTASTAGRSVKKTTLLAATDTPVDVTASGAMAKQRRPLTARQQASLAFQTGHSLMIKGRYADAEIALREALSLDPRHLKARELLAGSYVRRGNLAGATRLLQEGLAVAPTHTKFTKLYARVLAEQNAVPSAIQILVRNPPPVADDLEYHALLGALYQRQGQHKQAARTYSELVKLRRKAGMWWIGLGFSLEALGKNAEAALAYKNARDSDSLTGRLLQYVDARLSKLGQPTKPVN